MMILVENDKVTVNPGDSGSMRVFWGYLQINYGSHNGGMPHQHLDGTMIDL